MNLTQEQIEEAFFRFRDYAYWMYHSEKPIAQLKNVEKDCDGIKYRLYPNIDGNIEVALETGEIGIFNPVVLSHKIEDITKCIDNADFKCLFVNKSDFSPEKQVVFEKLALFVLSYFQRLVAFTFFSRMHDISIKEIAKVLASCNT